MNAGFMHLVVSFWLPSFNIHLVNKYSIDYSILGTHMVLSTTKTHFQHNYAASTALYYESCHLMSYIGYYGVSEVR